jgi:3-oxoacyl-[acyl-carrier protein] reductase
MDLGLSGRLALVTGASSGIGRSCALALAKEGARLAVGARRTELLERLVAEAIAAGSPEAVAYRVDLAEASSIETLLGEVRARQGEPEVLIANGGGPKPGGVSTLSVADWDAAYGPIMRAMLQLVYGVLPAMRERRWGRIVYLGSSSLKTPIPNLALSNAFRAGVLGALKTLSREVAPDGITINTIATGKIDTDRARSVYKEPGAWEKTAAEIPLGRFGSPDELAPLVAFLCGEPARYISGTTISVDGALSPTLT